MSKIGKLKKLFKKKKKKIMVTNILQVYTFSLHDVGKFTFLKIFENFLKYKKKKNMKKLKNKNNITKKL